MIEKTPILSPLEALAQGMMDFLVAEHSFNWVDQPLTPGLIAAVTRNGVEVVAIPFELSAFRKIIQNAVIPDDLEHGTIELGDVQMGDHIKIEVNVPVTIIPSEFKGDFRRFQSEGKTFFRQKPDLKLFSSARQRITWVLESALAYVEKGEIVWRMTPESSRLKRPTPKTAGPQWKSIA